MADAVAEGAVCRPNISGAGRRRRRMAGAIGAVLAVGLLAGLAWAHAAWMWRLLVALPAGIAAVSLLQVSRNTCVARAAEGTFENEDFSTTKMEDADVAASRKVAATIRRDSALIALAAGALAAATAFVA